MNKYYSRMPVVMFITALICSLGLCAAGILMFFTDAMILAPILVLFGIIALIVLCVLNINRRHIMEKLIDVVSENGNEITASLIDALPLPSVVANIDGTIKWHNEPFRELINKGNLFGKPITGIIKDLKWGDILKSKSITYRNTIIDGKRFELTVRLVKEAADDEDVYFVYIYLTDKSEYDELLKAYDNEKTDVALVCIDNYDEVMQRISDDEEERIVSGIRKCLNVWTQKGGALLKRQDNDRYYVIFDHVRLEKYIEDKFSIIESVRNIGKEFNAPVSISIGIGSGGTLIENDASARSALEMTQGRGGDQVCIKNNDSFKFYGGRTKEYEKSNRVKTRSVAGALKEFILNADKVYLMGHSNADFDCFGAAMGMQRAIRELGKEPYIVVDNNSPAIVPMWNALRQALEYENMYISREQAIESITSDSLVIVLDTHRPSMLPCPELMKYTNKVVVIDHHRRSMEFITPCALIYQEPYASSTCEMVTELVDYMNTGKKLTRLEAECLYTGILMDTKNFLVKTGVRTFEAASYLRKLGINTLDVKRLFNIDKLDYDHKVDIVKTSVEIFPGVALAEAKHMYPNIRVTASQAADEMLNIGDINASIVIYPIDNGYGVCARSIGEINVQTIMEELGGGGHATVAGVQLHLRDIDEVKNRIKRAVEDSLKNK